MKIIKNNSFFIISTSEFQTKITVKITDLTDVGDIRYHVKGVDTRFNRISYQEMKCMPEDELRKIMEDYEE